MKTIIGYRFEIKIDNGDTNEWFRELNIISDIYPTIQMARESYKLFIANEKDKKNKFIEDYINFQKHFEEDEKAFIERAYESNKEQINMMIMQYNRHRKYVPVYINDTPTANVIKFDIAD